MKLLGVDVVWAGKQIGGIVTIWEMSPGLPKSKEVSSLGEDFLAWLKNNICNRYKQQ